MIKALFFCFLLITAHAGIAPPANATPTLATGIPNSLSNRATPDHVTLYHIKSVPDRRFAIVIGNDSYKFQPLTTARADANAIGQMLRSMGFDVAVVTDATRANLHDTLERVQQHRDKFGTVLFYFAGHATSRGGSAWLLPIDTPDDSTTVSNGINIANIVKTLSSDTDQATILIIDACLTDPLSGSVASPISAPLPPRTLLAFASAPGGQAYDAAGHGLFTAELLTLLPQSGLSLHGALAAADQRVRLRSAFAQRPWFFSTLTTTFSLTPAFSPTQKNKSAPARESPTPTLSLALLGQPRGLLPQDGEARIELEYWKSIENSTDAAEYEAYLSTYPKGRFVALAKARIERYKKPAVPTKPANETKPPETKPAPPAPAPVAAPAPTAAPSKPVPVAEKVPDIKSPAIGKVQNQQDCPICPMLVVLPAGDFMMGDSGGDRSEKPAHRVSIPRSFAIGKTEVTTGQWSECVAAGQCAFKAETSGPAADSPVRDISWLDAQQYLRWLSQKTKQNYRLPTEAEWEYAARAGTTSRFWWGADVGAGHANCKNCGGAWNHAAPEVVTAFPANPFGLYGMNGSVWEWVSDCWYKSHEGAPADGSARGSEADCRQRVIRGGSWRDDATYVHSASRFSYDADVRYLTNGFRVAKTLP